MSDIRSRFKLMPLHGIVMCIAATLSFVSVFIPMFELFVQYKRERVFSLFSMIMNPRVYVQLRDGTVDLDFRGFGGLMFTLTLVVAVAALTLSLGFQLYSNTRKSKRLGCLTVMILFAMRLALHVVTLNKLVTP